MLINSEICILQKYDPLLYSEKAFNSHDTVLLFVKSMLIEMDVQSSCFLAFLFIRVFINLFPRFLFKQQTLCGTNH